MIVLWNKTHGQNSNNNIIIIITSWSVEFLSYRGPVMTLMIKKRSLNKIPFGGSFFMVIKENVMTRRL